MTCACDLFKEEKQRPEIAEVMAHPARWIAEQTLTEPLHGLAQILAEEPTSLTASIHHVVPSP